MKIRVVDYAANLGGGVRFAVELLRGLATIPGISFEVVSSGEALDRYRKLVAGVVPATFLDIPPGGTSRHRPVLEGVPGAGLLNWVLRRPDFAFVVPPAAVDGCDVAWFPWVHRHRLPPHPSSRIVGSLHDTIILDFPRAFSAAWSRSEHRTLRGWMDSPARIAVSSNATAASLRRLFGIPDGRVSIIPLTGQHEPPDGTCSRASWPFRGRTYLLCPANHSRHKNHDVLLPGVSRIASRHPLVLTGEGTNFHELDSPRARELRRLAGRAGLVQGQSLFSVGYVNDADYYAILDGAWALVMPTLAEGGGSFPVWEALEKGIPAVVSDIPVLREMMERVGAEVLWFDPADPADLARALGELEEGYDRFKERALSQRAKMSRRSWADVAADYARLLGAGDPVDGAGQGTARGP